MLYLYNNGTWELGYEWAFAKGTYVMQNDGILLTTKWILPETGVTNVGETRLIEFDVAGKTLVGWWRSSFEDNYPEECVDYSCCTRADFIKRGKSLLKGFRNEAM